MLAVMLTQPQGALQAYSLPNGVVEFIPVPLGNWYMFSTKAQAQKVLDLALKNFPSATLKLVSGTQNGNAAFMLLPVPNPLGLDVWIIQGTVPLTSAGEQGTLNMDDYAGDVWDRGPVDQGFGGSPDMLDTNGAYGGIGGENLTYFNAGGGLAEFKWSENPQQPVG